MTKNFAFTLDYLIMLILLNKETKWAATNKKLTLDVKLAYLY
jgi:hypothetical protein